MFPPKRRSALSAPLLSEPLHPEPLHLQPEPVCCLCLTRYRHHQPHLAKAPQQQVRVVFQNDSMGYQRPIKSSGQGERAPSCSQVPPWTLARRTCWRNQSTAPSIPSCEFPGTAAPRSSHSVVALT